MCIRDSAFSLYVVLLIGWHIHWGNERERNAQQHVFRNVCFLWGVFRLGQFRLPCVVAGYVEFYGDAWCDTVGDFLSAVAQTTVFDCLTKSRSDDCGFFIARLRISD